MPKYTNVSRSPVVINTARGSQRVQFGATVELTEAEAAMAGSAFRKVEANVPMPQMLVESPIAEAVAVIEKVEAPVAEVVNEVVEEKPKKSKKYKLDSDSE